MDLDFRILQPSNQAIISNLVSRRRSLLLLISNLAVVILTKVRKITIGAVRIVHALFHQAVITDLPTNKQ